MRRRVARVRLAKRSGRSGICSKTALARRVRTRTLSQESWESVGQWILVSTIVVSTRNRLPSSNTELHGCQHHDSIDGLNRLGGDLHEGSMEGLVARYSIAPKGGELPQRETVGDSLPQLAQIPILDALEEQGAQGLLCAETPPSASRPFEPAHEIAVNEIDELGALVEKSAQTLEHRIERDFLGEKLEVCEAPLSSCPRLPHPASPVEPISFQCHR